MENYFMNYDQTTGAILGFYLVSIHGVNIPTPNIVISPAKHDFYMANDGLYKIDPVTLADVLLPVVDPGIQPPTLQEQIDANSSVLSALMGV